MHEHSRKYSELARALRNMIRTGIIVETDLTPVAAACRPAACAPTGFSGYPSRRSFAHMVGTFRGRTGAILSVGGELDTAFVLPGIYSGITPRRLRRRMPCISVSLTGRD